MTIELHEINTHHPYYAFVEELLHEAFPEAERRETYWQRYNTDEKDEFHTLVVIKDGKAVGLLTYWSLPGFTYVEHLAIDASSRGNEIGTTVFRQFMKKISSPIVLEVEPAESSDLARLRIEFYRRLGLRLWHIPYIQPSYRSGGDAIPLNLMASDSLDEDVDHEKIIDAIHFNVYGQR